MTAPDLDELRKAIDGIDEQLLALLSQRARHALMVGDVKKVDNAPVYRPEREARVVARLQEINPGPLPPGAVAAIWREVMSACRGLEHRLRVAYLGPAGTFSEQAMRERFGSEVDGIACPTIDEVFRITEAEAADFGVVPVENSTEGAVNRSLDLFLTSPLVITGEVTVRVRHILMSREGKPEIVSKVCAHPQALAQCTNWLNRNHPTLERIPVASNAEGARMAAADPALAAIAGNLALDLYGLKAIAQGIQDDPMNRTRFLVVGRHRAAPSGCDQTSLILAVPDRAGAVHALIEPLARHGVSMKRFESRPARQGGWEYYFYIDLIGHQDDPGVAPALAELKAQSAFYKSLGSYPYESGATSASATSIRTDPVQGSPADDSPSYVKGIAPYRPGKPIEEVAREYGLEASRIIKLASNENPLGVPAGARAAIQAALDDLGRYPDGNGFELKAAIARKYGVPVEWITLGNGSNDGLELAARAVCAAGQSIVYSQYSFAVYALATQAIGARAIEVAALAYGHDLDAMAAAIAADTRVVFVANPNNPTGTFVDGQALEAFLAKVPARVAVVLDEAYTEYLDPEQRYDAMLWVRKYPNLIVSRTLSKAYGLAGLRVGFMVAQTPITDLMNRVRQPFNVNSLAQAAAIAALADADFLARSYRLNRDGLRQLSQGFAMLGLEFVPSAGNFVLVRIGRADLINERLLRAGVIVRPVGNYNLPQWLRVSVGLPEENSALLEALGRAIAEPLPDPVPGPVPGSQARQAAV